MSSRLSEYLHENRTHPIRRLRHHRPAPPERTAGYTIAGLIVVAVLAVVAWQIFGADLRRYLKIKSM